MAKRYFKGEDPIGKRILIQELLYGQPGLGPEIAWEVVGIVGDEQTGEPGRQQRARAFMSPTTKARPTM